MGGQGGGGVGGDGDEDDGQTAFPIAAAIVNMPLVIKFSTASLNFSCNQNRAALKGSKSSSETLTQCLWSITPSQLSRTVVEMKFPSDFLSVNVSIHIKDNKYSSLPFCLSMSVSATLGLHFNAENIAQNPEILNLLFLLFSAPPFLCYSSYSSLVQSLSGFICVPLSSKGRGQRGGQPHLVPSCPVN